MLHCPNHVWRALGYEPTDVACAHPEAGTEAGKRLGILNVQKSGCFRGCRLYSEVIQEPDDEGTITTPRPTTF
jgi:hypothetical protein